MRSDIDIRLAMLSFLNCDWLVRESPQRLLDALIAVGTTFPALLAVPNYDLRSRLETNDRFLSIQHPVFTHPAPVASEMLALGTRFQDVTSAECVHDKLTQAVLISQQASCRSDGDASVDATFSGLLRFGELLFPHLLPTFGYVDDFGEPVFGYEDVQRLDLGAICWANFFGSHLVKHLGRAFLHDAPAWRVVDLPNDGVLIQATRSFVEWRYAPDFGECWPYEWDARLNHPLAKHFHRFYPDLVIYRGEADRD
jgi:hypothetical protein